MTTRLRRHRLPSHKRLALGAVVGAVVGIAAGIGVHAFMNAFTTNTLGLNSGAVNAEGALSTPTVSGRDVTITWPADTVTGGTPTTYYVLRDNSGASGTCSGIQSASTFSCKDTSVPSGTHTYTVVPTYLSWTGASASVTSPAVGTPALSVSPTSTTTLPKNLSGSVSNFADSETITFRLDDAITGTVLTTSPATVTTGATGGTASPTITVPANIADGSHTIYAVGNLGDTASATFTVNVPATLSFTNGTFSTLPSTLTGGAITYFRAGESVTFHLDGAAGTPLTSSPGTVPIGANGQTSSPFTVTVPASIADGTHTVYAVGGSGSQATYAITVSVPSTFSIDPGQTFTSLSGTVTGGAVTYFGASENLVIRLDGVSGTILATSPSPVTTNANGQVSGFSATIPANIAHGTHTLVAMGATSGLTATSNTFTVSVPTTFSITNAQSLPASSLPASVTGGAVAYFGNAETLTIHLDTAGGTSLTTTPSPLTTDSNGQASGFSVSIPANTLGGTHTLWAVGNSSNLSAQSNSFTVAASATGLSPTTGVVASSASIVAQGFLPTHSLTVTVGGASASITGGSNTNGSGSSTVSFTIPAVSNGSQAVVVSDGASTVTSGTNFTVSASATSLSPTSGPVGTSGVTIQANGFSASGSLTVKVAGNTAAIASGGTAGANGSSLVTFTIPSAPHGSQIVTVSDGTNTATSTSNFTVQASVSVSQSSGTVGTTGVTLTGTGFVAGQTVSVTFASNPLTTSPASPQVGTTGGWTATFTVPPSTTGAKSIVATDSGSATASTTYAVTPSASVSPSSGNVGSTVTLSGSGFPAGAAISATYAGSSITLSGTLTTDGSGNIPTSTPPTFTVPATASGSLAGAHPVVVTAGSQTAPSVNFTVTPSITLTPSTGAAGSSDTITGTGFAVTSALTVTFNTTGVTLGGSTSTNANGAITGATYTVPSLGAGPYTVLVKDASNNQATATFTVTAAAFTLTGVSFSGSVNGIPETGDAMTLTFSGNVLASTVPATPSVVFNRPNSSGAHATVAISGIFSGLVDTGGTGYLTQNGNKTATFASTTTVSGTTIKVTLGAKTGDTVGAGTSGSTTVSIPPASSITDTSGNAASGTFTTGANFAFF
ncbi:MAG TPA: hypothetical protein VN193_14075 [Candidatus Angelobacter sp.]|jgi:hypothetical protein|nr:hypothetical protein [Candidatus Angelobacter sp.]